MATKKSTKPATKKTSTVKKTTKAPTKKVATKKVEPSIYNTSVPILLAMAIEALILLLGYLIIMNA